ncbi:MAG: ABC transporter ATP-binding protein [Oscillospiraceae bacterium]|jgi:oligopeptide transport system ATP-binding protein|nr:ABC transporter ATP-binding protein [Oscillospiraceae bacterium]
MPTNTPLLSVKDLVVDFTLRGQRLTAIRGASIDVFEGDSLAIVGESGSGKSVLVKTFLGMLDKNGRIASGGITYKGTDISKYDKEADWLKIRGREIAIVMQDPMTSLNPLKTIGEQIGEAISLHQKLSGSEKTKAIADILEDVGITEAARRMKQYPHEFSGGMRQRVVIAIAMACRPKILICDEPTTALDVTIQAQILELIGNLRQKYNLTVIYITHDLGVVARVADRVAVMYAGDIIEQGTCEDVFFRPAHPYTWALLSSLPQIGVKGEPLYAIKGTPPSLYEDIKGDAFAPRNPRALEADRKHRPPIFRISETHSAKTWLLDNRAPNIEPPPAVSRVKDLQ